MKYQVTVTAVGDFVLELLRTRESMIIFNKDVPFHYREMVVSHTKAELKSDIALGDTLTVGDLEYEVTAIGETAMADLRKNGHVTLVFTGESEAAQPGQIVVRGSYMPRVMVGDSISFG